MITIKLSRNFEKLSVRLEVSGHAGQAEKGHDIVCSAVSILTYTFATVIKELDFSERLAEPAIVEMTSGSAVIQAVCRFTNNFSKVIIAMDTVEKGYELIEDKYPEYVELIEA